MFCVIQEVKNKKTPYQPTSKKIEVTTSAWTIGGVTRTSYGYSYSSEKFDRPIKKAYKISIHKSYREKEKIKKKQWVICTMGYYNLLEFWPGDCILQSKLKEKLEEMKITEDDLWGMVYSKLDPIIKRVKEEFQQTKEYEAQQEQKRILDEYRKAKNEFESKYGADTYQYCYDVFRNLRNEDYLNQLKAEYKAQQEYKERSYHDSNYSNYDWSKFSSYYGTNQSNYTKGEIELVEKIIKTGYKQLAKRFHPDTGGSKEAFQLLGNLKDKMLNHIK